MCTVDAHRRWMDIYLYSQEIVELPLNITVRFPVTQTIDVVAKREIYSLYELTELPARLEIHDVSLEVAEGSEAGCLYSTQH